VLLTVPIDLDVKMKAVLLGTVFLIVSFTVIVFPYLIFAIESRLSVFSERELMFMFAICRRPSVCLSVVCRLSVTFVHPTQPMEIFGNVSAPCNTLVT